AAAVDPRDGAGDRRNRVQAALAAFATAVETADGAPGAIDPARPAGYLLWQADLQRQQGHVDAAASLLAQADARYATSPAPRRSFDCFRARVACEIERAATAQEGQP
ncbi:MAG: hypothetical protein DYG90_05380, partial [Chloroflexi bacterium CFX6]|nr:hypothetical protein [Chloroflexi bacterium CFX6]